MRINFHSQGLHELRAGKFCSRLILAGLFSVLLVSCGSVDRDAVGEVQGLTRSRIGKDISLPRSKIEQQNVDERVAALLKKPLTADGAVQAALLNNRRLRATLEELNLSQADLLESSLLSNPTFATSHRFLSGGGTTDSQFELTGDVLDWLLLPLRRKLALKQYEAAKCRVSHEILQLAAEVKSAFYEMQGDKQFLTKLEAAAEINRASSDIAERLNQAGNINELELLQEQTGSQQVRLELMRTRASLVSSREKVNRLLGLSGASVSRWSVAENLPELPSSDPAFDKMESLALAQRQDLAAQKETVEAYAQALSLKSKMRLFPAVNLGVNTERNSDETRVTGPTLDLQIPIFNWGTAKIKRAEAEFAQAHATWEALESDVRSDVRAAVSRVRAARTAAEYLRTTMLPLRQKILSQTLLHYNAMQVSTIVLLRAKEDEVTAERESIEAYRAYWTARAELERAVGGSLSARRSPTKRTLPQAAANQPVAAEHRHHVR